MSIESEVLLYREQMQVEIPKVIRNSRGQIRWTKKGASVRENEDMAVRNIQGLLIEQISEIRELLVIKEGQWTIKDEYREQARALILKHCGTSEAFVSCFGIMPVFRRIFPTFQGRYQLILKMALGPWGVRFKFRDFSLPPHFWEDLDLNGAITALQNAFLDEFPEFEKFLSSNNKCVAAGMENEAKAYVLSKVGAGDGFFRIYGTSIQKKDKCPHFDASFIKAVKYMLEHWGINNVRTFDFGQYRRWSDWMLPSNSPQENEQLGIRNVQGLFLERFPEFESRFLVEEGRKVSREKQEEAKLFIVERVGSFKNFTKNLGICPTQRETTPYFEGSYQAALRKSFEPWGIDFNNLPPHWSRHDLVVGFTERGLPIDKQGRIIWSQVNDPSRIASEIELIAAQLINSGARFTENDFKNAGRLDIYIAARRFYPGGLDVLRQKLGIIKPRRRENGFWRSEEGLNLMRNEATSIFQKYGYLSHFLLIQEGKTDVLSAITSYYPGGFVQLKSEVGIIYAKVAGKAMDPISSEQANEQLRKILESKV